MKPPYEALTQQYHNIFEFAAGTFGLDRHATQNQVDMAHRCGDKLFRWTEHGLGLCPLDSAGKRATDDTPVWGIKVTGIVEGTDIEASSKPLMFPLVESDLWKACDDVAESLDDSKAEWDAQGDFQ